MTVSTGWSDNETHIRISRLVIRHRRGILSVLQTRENVVTRPDNKNNTAKNHLPVVME
jgi:hypothetical protein